MFRCRGVSCWIVASERGRRPEQYRLNASTATHRNATQHRRVDRYPIAQPRRTRNAPSSALQSYSRTWRSPFVRAPPTCLLSGGAAAAAAGAWGGGTRRGGRRGGTTSWRVYWALSSVSTVFAARSVGRKGGGWRCESLRVTAVRWRCARCSWVHRAGAEFGFGAGVRGSDWLAWARCERAAARLRGLT